MPLVDGGPGFTLVRYGVEEAAFAIRFRGQVHAYFNRCAHVPVELDWQHEFFDDSLCLDLRHARCTLCP